MKTVLVENLADRRDPPIHHIRGRDHVSAGARVGQRFPGEQLERAVVVDVAIFDNTTMPMVRVLAKADVGNHEQLRKLVIDRVNCPLNNAVLRISLAADGIFLFGNAEQDHGGNSQRADLLAFTNRAIDGKLRDAGHRRNRLRPVFSRSDEQGINKIFGL